MTVHLYHDSLTHPGGGTAAYLDALARHVHASGIPVVVHVVEAIASPIVDDLLRDGIAVRRQRRLPGDRWNIRKRAMVWHLGRALQPGDWVFAVCPPYPPVYERLARTVHARRAKLGVSWFLAPEFWPPTTDLMGRDGPSFCRAVAATDAVVSVSRCTAYQFAEVYGYAGPVLVVPYHNRVFFPEPVPLPAGPPWNIGFLGRLDRQQKNLDGLIRAFARLAGERSDILLHLFGDGLDRTELQQLASECGVSQKIAFHGVYDHRSDLHGILSRCHFIVHPSRWEGGPCFSLLEAMQAGRWCVASSVGGIPDLFEDHPECGFLVPRGDDGSQLVEGLRRGVELVSASQIDVGAIRRRYHDGFDMVSAHRAWLAALD